MIRKCASFIPWRTDSSPKCGKAELTTAWRPVLQAPILPAMRFTPQSRGQARHSSSSRLACSPGRRDAWMKVEVGLSYIFNFNRFRLGENMTQ